MYLGPTDLQCCPLSNARKAPMLAKTDKHLHTDRQSDTVVAVIAIIGVGGGSSTTYPLKRSTSPPPNQLQRLLLMICSIDVINVYNVYKKFFVNAFVILSTFISIKITWAKRSKIMTGSQAIVHCVRIGHWLSSLGHGASNGKQLPHDGAPHTEQTSRLEDDWAYAMNATKIISGQDNST